LNIIFSYGMPKSGSSFAWMIINYLCVSAKLDVINLSSDAKNNESYENYINAEFSINNEKIINEINNGWCVIKTHSGPFEFDNLRDKSSKHFSFAQHRDPREIYLSLMDHAKRSQIMGINDFIECRDLENCIPVIDDAINKFFKWVDEYKSVAISYEYLCFKSKFAIMDIAKKICLDADIDQILEKFKDKSEIIQFNKGKIRRWETEISSDESEFFIKRYEEYYERFGIS
jgi:hypothetical protein